MVGNVSGVLFLAISLVCFHFFVCFFPYFFPFSFCVFFKSFPFVGYFVHGLLLFCLFFFVVVGITPFL